MQLSLPEAEAQHRQAVLADTATLSTPLISITDSGLDQKAVTFSATDDNLAAVLLLVDNKLRTDVSLTWNRTKTVTVSVSYNINTTILNNGLHNVKILAFDEHGANNGGPDKPSKGGWPSSNEINFYVGTAPAPTPSLFPTATQSPTPYPSPIQTPAPANSPTQTPQPTSSGNPTLSTSATPSPNQNPFPTVTIVAVTAALIATSAGLLLSFKKHIL